MRSFHLNRTWMWMPNGERRMGITLSNRSNRNFATFQISITELWKSSHRISRQLLAPFHYVYRTEDSLQLRVEVDFNIGKIIQFLFATFQPPMVVALYNFLQAIQIKMRKLNYKDFSLMRYRRTLWKPKCDWQAWKICRKLVFIEMLMWKKCYFIGFYLCCKRKQTKKKKNDESSRSTSMASHHL